MPTRLDKMRAKLGENGLDAMFVSQAQNRRYLSGFAGSAGFLIISQRKAILATDFRYVEQAKMQAPGWDVFKAVGALERWFPGLVADMGVRRLGFESRDVTFAAYGQLEGCLRNAGKGFELVSTDGLVETLRMVKDDSEIERLKKAAAIADAGLEFILPRIRPGMSEKQVAWALESFMRENGSEPLPFDIIAGSGPNAALPHARPTDRPIGENEPLVLDFGARVEGYASDFTRTICLGKCDSTFQRVYDTVLGAQLTAMATIRAGMTGEQADRLARTVIEEAGYGDAFGHSLGHSVGLAEHEDPRLGSGSALELTDNMVFTVEPGIYLPGWGGVRIEDTVMLKDGKVQPLTRGKK